MARIFLRTFGCAHNQADSEMMAGQLLAAGHELVDTLTTADLVLLNSCTVKDPSQQRFLYEAREAAKTKPVVIAGCVPQADPENPELQGFSIVGVKQLHKVVEVVDRTLKGERVKENLRTPTNPPLLLPVKRRNPYIEIIPVNSGCLGKCTFCKTKHARGHLASYQPKEIVEKARRAVANGAKELWLTSEDLGAYGRDISTTITELARQILELDGDFMVRLGMANPPLMQDLAEELVRILQHPKCYTFLHIPVQSGSDRILGLMKREYTIQEFERLIRRLEAGVPGITIATDIIVGFPGETEEDHQQTMELLKRHRFPILNISKFYARPGTPAARLKPLPTAVVKQRSEEVTRLYESYNRNEELVGQTVPVLFTERSKKDADRIIGHTPNYREVVLQKGVVSNGSCAPVTLTKAHKYYLEGEKS